MDLKTTNSQFKQLRQTTMSMVKSLYRLWPGTLGIPALIVVWIVSPWVLRMIDPTAATFDAGVLQIFLYAIIGIVLFNDMAFIGIKLNFPVVFNWYKNEAGKAFNDLTSWQKIIVLLALYLGLLLCFVLLASVMLSPSHGSNL